MKLLEEQLYVKTSTLPNSGKGLFTKKLIEKGDRIVKYKGTVTTWKEVSHDKGENGYIYFMNNKHVINARPHPEALARYANDAQGLTKIKGIKNNAEYIEEGKDVFIVARRDIKRGEEIFVGYGKDYWDVIRHNIKVEKSNKKLEEAKQKEKKKKRLAKEKKDAVKKARKEAARKRKTAKKK